MSQTTTQNTATADTELVDPAALGALSHPMVFVNLPVADVEASRAFFARIGYTFDPRMSNGSCLGLVLGPNIYAMLLQREFFAQFHDAQVATGEHVEVLTCLAAASREQVDQIVDAALAAGGREVRREETGDFMYGRTYADLDGHHWEMMWMDVEAATAAGTFG